MACYLILDNNVSMSGRMSGGDTWGDRRIVEIFISSSVLDRLESTELLTAETAPDIQGQLQT